MTERKQTERWGSAWRDCMNSENKQVRVAYAAVLWFNHKCGIFISYLYNNIYMIIMSYLRYNPIWQSENNYFRTDVLDVNVWITKNTI